MTPTLPVTTQPNPRRDEIEARFWAKVSKTDGCWQWTAAGANGYGRFCIRKPVIVGAHRMSFELAYGPIPAGQLVCHRCDNRRCVRPDHLFLGSQLDNMRDMIAKGRAAIGAARNLPAQAGQANHAAKLTDDQVRSIRSRRAGGERPAAIAADLGIARGTVWAIVAGKRWGHIA